MTTAGSIQRRQVPWGVGHDLLGPLKTQFGSMHGTFQMLGPGNTTFDVEIRGFKYFPDMVEAVCDEVERLMQDEGVDQMWVAMTRERRHLTQEVVSDDVERITGRPPRTRRDNFG